jgi:hypothetical protein
VGKGCGCTSTSSSACTTRSWPFVTLVQVCANSKCRSRCVFLMSTKDFAHG